MEEILQTLKDYINVEVAPSRSEELEFYTNLAIKNPFYGNFNLQFSPEDFLLATINVKLCNGFSKNKELLQELKKIGFFSNNGERSVAVIEKLLKLNYKELQSVIEFAKPGGLKIFKIIKFYREKSFYDETNYLKLAHLMQKIRNKYFKKDKELFLDFLSTYERIHQRYFEAYIDYVHLLKQIEKDSETKAESLEEYYVLKIVYKEWLAYKKYIDKKYESERREQQTVQSLCQARIKSIRNASLDTYLSLTVKEQRYLPINLQKSLESYFLDHNQKIFDQLNQEIANQSTHRQEELRSLFTQYQVPYFKNKEYAQQLLETGEKTSLEEKLILLKNLPIPLSEPQQFFFLTSRIGDLKFISSLLEKEISLSFFARELKAILTPQNLDTILMNLEFLKKKTANINSYDEVLLLDSSLLERQIALLELYHLEIKKETILNSLEESYFDAIDSWIENGYFAYLSQNLSVIKTDINQITKRMKIAASLNLPIFDESGNLLPLVLREDKFFLSNPELDEYINSQSMPFQDLETTSLDTLDSKYLTSPVTYNIEGNWISRPKVIRKANLNQEASLSLKEKH